jgi:hypothetical protein
MLGSRRCGGDVSTQGSTAHVGVIDWRNKDAADYYVNEVIGLHTATDKNIDGAETALSLSLSALRSIILSPQK